MLTYQTPQGDLEVDQETIEELKTKLSFEETDKDAEEEEHSIEMQLPFLIKLFGPEKIKLIPVMVGSLDEA